MKKMKRPSRPSAIRISFHAFRSYAECGVMGDYDRWYSKDNHTFEVVRGVDAWEGSFALCHVDGDCKQFATLNEAKAALKICIAREPLVQSNKVADFLA